MEGTIKISALLLLVFVGLAAGSPDKGLDCIEIDEGVNACANLLRNYDRIKQRPSFECCIGLQKIARTSVGVGVDPTCECLLTSPLLVDKFPGDDLKLAIKRLASASKTCRSVVGGGKNDGTDDLLIKCALSA